MMLNPFPGILYVLDNVDNIAGAMSADVYGRHVVLNLSEDISTTKVEDIFKGITQDATILCPPPGAVYMEIDGDTEGFKNYYNNYLCSDEVKRFILLTLYAVHTGVNVYMYIPEFTNESMWIGMLLNHLLYEYGISVGFVGKRFSFDPKIADKVMCDLYLANFINPFELISFINTTDYLYPYPLEKMSNELKFYGCETNDVMKFVMECKANQQYAANRNINTPPVLRPAIVFV